MLAENKQSQNKVFSRKRMEKALNSTFRTAPKNMSREQKRAFMSGKAHHRYRLNP